MSTSPARHDVILDFWFGPDRENPAANYELWYSGTPQIDKQIADRFLPDIEAAIAGDLQRDGWLDDKLKLTALVILLDQFGLNVYRDTPKSFATSALAIPVTYHALEKGFDKQLPFLYASFIYHPLMHSEKLEDQSKCVELYAQHTSQGDDVAKYAVLHQQVIAKYGRFPGRNAVMGRVSTPEELEYLQNGGEF